MKDYSLIVFFAGMVICFYALAVVRRCKKTFQTEIEVFESKIKSLEETLRQSDEMVEELNNLSDYVAARIEEANTKLVKTLTLLDEKIDSGSDVLQNLDEQLQIHQELLGKSREIVDKISESGHIVVKPMDRKTNNPKHAEAIKLAEEGLTVREIAKQLNMGQGEVKLLLGIQRQE